MSRRQRVRRCGAWHLPRATAPTAPALARAADRVTARERSTRRCRQRQVLAAGSRLVVHGVVFDGGAFWLAVPDRNGAFRCRREHDFANRLPDDRRYATAGPSGRL